MGLGLGLGLVLDVTDHLAPVAVRELAHGADALLVRVRVRVMVRVRARVRVRVSTAPMLSLALRGTETMLTAAPLAAVTPTVARKCAK